MQDMNLVQQWKRATRVVLLGYGAINSRVASLLHARQSNAFVVGVIVKRARSLSGSVAAGTKTITEPSELADLNPDIILEAASREAVREWGLIALRTARRVVISSASALADDDLLRDLKSAARLAESQLVLSPGALAGVDALAACARLPMREVRHRIIKAPKSWGTAMDRSSNPIQAGVPVTLFEGSARDAAKRYPLNANVTVVTALASLGLDRTVVELVSDPTATNNCHEIHASGEFGSMMIQIRNRALHSNPKSSELAALALVRLAENEFAHLVV